MKRGYRYSIYLAISIFLCNVAYSQTKISLTKKSVENIVILSVYSSDLLAEQSLMILDGELIAIDTESEFNKRVEGLKEVRDITQALLGMLTATESTLNIDIMEINSRLNIAFNIGERLYLGELLGVVIDSVSDINELPDLLDFISKTTVSLDSDEIQGTVSGQEISSVPNIYRDISRPNIYQEVMGKLHNDFRESTTTKDGGGFKESENDATQI